LANAEIQARKKKVGLWALTNQIAPWEYRKHPKSNEHTNTVSVLKD